ncbi:MAG: hypothetical protein F4117_12435 [Acidimicrobiales bacterium]|nr:hypothetical protein [Acidimicrobiaceae bacterium]MXV88053.1 hypothetical protein [Acidimicrobiales bacterium]MDE0678574.1 hypothetical protein [Acidimicrobiaceae bacterium]MXX42178.1 hypothetical protein [Acidimicrobiales bacterium]MXY02215.1 hypothetical protein [Acidimicrobiales bacterium]
MTADEDQHELDKMRGLTFLWALAVVGGTTLMFALTQWGLVDDVPMGDIAAIAVGASNGIGVVAFGGWNAIGVVSVGGANSVGIVAIGGLNSIGIVSFGGVNAVGMIAFGGLNSYGTSAGVRFLAWRPLRVPARKR